MTAPQSKNKFFIFKTLTIFFPIVLLVLFELTLRLFNYGGDFDIFVIDETNKTPQYVLNKNFMGRYFFKKGINPPDPRSQTFSVEKDNATYRIFCLGASTTQGVPYPPNAAFPAMLKNILAHLNPSKNFEVLNLGITAITSHSVQDIGAEVLDKYEPDLLVVYSGHNEFYGVFGQASRLALFDNHTFIQLFLKLQRSRIFMLGRNIYLAIFGESIDRKDVVDPKTLMGTVAKNIEIPIDGELFKVTEEHYRKNLQSIINAAKHYETDLLVCNLVSNLKDLPPFAPVFNPSIADHIEEQIKEKLRQSEKLYKNGQITKAVEVLENALLQDSTYSETLYRLGKVHLALNDSVNAHKYFMLAQDYDNIRFRAPSHFNKILRQTASENNIPLVDLNKAFQSHSPKGIPGNNLILEHIHPNATGYFVMAKTLVQKMSQEKMVGDNWNWKRDLPDSAYLAMNRLSLLSHEVTNTAIHRLTSHWPFNENQRKEFERVGTERTEQLARDYIFKGKGRLVDIHLILAGENAKANNLNKAVSEYGAALAIEPSCFAYNQLALVYSRQTQKLIAENKQADALKKYNKALVNYDTGLSICPDDPELLLNKGKLLSLLNKNSEKAIQLFEQILMLEPKNPSAFRNLVKIYLRDKNYGAAKTTLKKALNIFPKDAEFHSILGMVSFIEKNFVVAGYELETALSLNPNDERAKDLLKQLKNRDEK